MKIESDKDLNIRLVRERIKCIALIQEFTMEMMDSVFDVDEDVELDKLMEDFIHLVKEQSTEMVTIH